MKRPILAFALAALAILAAAPETQAQTQPGRRLYCGPTENTSTCGPSASPGIGSSCANAGCHNRNPLNDAQGRAMRGAGSPGTISGSGDAGMQAALSNYTQAEIDAIAAYLMTLVGGGGSPPSCSLTTSNPTPNTGTTITLTASCSNSPTSYTWTNCTGSTTATCTTTRSTAGNVTYSVTATNASGTSTPASVNVGWTTPGGPPPPPPPPPPLAAVTGAVARE